MPSHELPRGLTRTLLAAPAHAAESGEIYSGVARRAATVWASEIRPHGSPPRTAIIVAHPTANFLGHYALVPLALRGYSAIGLTTRYVGNDSNVRIENCLLDIAAVVHHLRDRGYEKIGLIGNSGGASIAPYYQAQAQQPSVTNPPGGGPNLQRAELPQVDGVGLLMAHSGRARLLTEWLDPAIYDERRPFQRDPELDMYDERNGPPFQSDFLETYRQAQIARNHRITEWAEALLRDLRGHHSGGLADFAFTVHGTYADPRSLDGAVDASDREVGTSLWGTPAVTNHLPVALGRFTTARSWLNQFSLRHSLSDALRWLPQCTVPVHVVYGSADTAAHPQHSLDMYNAANEPRTLTQIVGATHYFDGQPTLLEEGCDAVAAWAARLSAPTPTAAVHP